MRTKQVNRYYCDFCKKSGGSASSMSKHEKHCTKNPGRLCRVCQMIKEEQAPIEELLALLPEAVKDEVESKLTGDGVETCMVFDAKEINEALPALREAANNCPACVMAALRQKGWPVPVATDFSFTKEMESI